MTQFILATHSTLAEGFAGVARFFKSDLENIRYINAYVESQEFEKELREMLGQVKGEPVIVLTDILGGSVNQVAARLMPEYGYQLVTGINLPLLLDLIFVPGTLTPERIREGIERASGQIIYINDYIEQEENL